VRLVKVRINGYKRLFDTTCNLDSKLVAILGPNEAGKSSLLEALAWLTTGGALGPTRRTHNAGISDATAVVETHWMLDAADRDAVGDLAIDQTPTRVILGRRADGTEVFTVEPPVRRDPAPFHAAQQRVASFAATTVASTLPRGEDDGAGDRLDRVRRLIADSEHHWQDHERAWLTGLIEDLEALTGRGATRARRAVEALQAVLAVLQGAEASQEARERLESRVPSFLSLSDDDRLLQSAYDLNDPAVVTQPSKALRNLTQVAELDLNELLGAIHAGNQTAVHTMCRRANERLERLFLGAWRQSELTVIVTTDGTILRLLLSERWPNGQDTDISERSDGLKAFVALVCFLALQHHRDRVVILIDEAEAHLHYDGQADLINVLLQQTQAQQVIYTTHSPGCLPPDIGTGVRFISPDPASPGISSLHNNFWTRGIPGYSPLLIAMGASAAAFASPRRAVLAEGASDMILLPTLIRHATNTAELDYQVAPGLSNANAEQFGDLDLVAARVVYLVDGDEQGRRLTQRLTAAGVPRHRILSYPKGMAMEDTLNPACYRGAVNTLLREANPSASQMTESDLQPNQTRARSVEQWGRLRSVHPPSKVAIASYLLQHADQISLSRKGIKALQSINTNITKILASPT
jgi:predicted ATPase